MSIIKSYTLQKEVCTLIICLSLIIRYRIHRKLLFVPELQPSIFTNKRKHSCTITLHTCHRKTAAGVWSYILSILSALNRVGHNVTFENAEQAPP